ncbi:Lrs4p KNAG_0C03080 [Huiozyma naganishii CBS 8797]|uniref:Uncharacterized protein n=1 Tax=Huiozyma naganishii (strain ATCC MYA-139 / BCRC 22969 / CBS 8797 / KCTC 17520 / NBRC 10181 / NCYC 3082 / Yp74L-3) TaxID=1071383 RepID=J7S4Q8_HUIN7|nr:hypothetical protein KNAG_0C03080 [Kazachstania naganishii CBS 8797]CCK69419.1 hypothetical protein KNAG_0C03080 [Kazachstania naganishii CBS 8797]
MTTLLQLLWNYHRAVVHNERLAAGTAPGGAGAGEDPGGRALQMQRQVNTLTGQLQDMSHENDVLRETAKSVRAFSESKIAALKRQLEALKAEGGAGRRTKGVGGHAHTVATHPMSHGKRPLGRPCSNTIFDGSDSDDPTVLGIKAEDSFIESLRNSNEIENRRDRGRPARVLDAVEIPLDGSLSSDGDTPPPPPQPRPPLHKKGKKRRRRLTEIKVARIASE